MKSNLKIKWGGWVSVLPTVWHFNPQKQTNNKVYPLLFIIPDITWWWRQKELAGHPVPVLQYRVEVLQQHRVLLYFVANWSSVASFLLIIIDINVFDTNMRGGKDDPFRNKTVRRTVVVTHTCIDWPQGLITDGLGEEEERGRRRPQRDEGILSSVTNSFWLLTLTWHFWTL